MSCKINKIVIWGHKLHTHTHSYIHNAYYRAFKSLGYDTFWYDENDDIINICFKNALFITENQVDNNIPKRDDCLYIVHNLDDSSKYGDIPIQNIINLKSSYRDNHEYKDVYWFNKNQHSFCSNNSGSPVYFTLWGTDLLPEEIENNMVNIDTILSKREDNCFYHVGMANKLWNGIMNYLHYDLNINIRHLGGVWQEKQCIDEFEAMNSLQKSVLALAFQNEQQIQQKYVPCRIFKNISYGRMGVTNHGLVNTIFNNKIIYNTNIELCIMEAVEFEQLPLSRRREAILPLMEFVKNNHTYVSRIQDLRHFISVFTNFAFE
jgi:hypothetical protein